MQESWIAEMKSAMLQFSVEIDRLHAEDLLKREQLSKSDDA